MVKSDFVGDVKKRNVFDVVVEKSPFTKVCPELYARQEHSKFYTKQSRR